MSPHELKTSLSSDLLSFPLSGFDADLRFEPRGYADRLEWLMPYGATVLFAAGGTGEFFSLEPQEYAAVIKTAADTCRGRVPIVGGAGGGTTLDIRYPQEAGRNGAQVGLPLPQPRRMAGAPRGGGLQERAHWCRRLQPRCHEAHPRIAAQAGRALPQPDRIQGRARRHRTHRFWRMDTARGTIGAALVKRAPPGGNTLFVSSLGPFVIAPHLIKDVQYDALKDFDPITVAVQAPNVLVVPASSPYRSLADLLAGHKKTPAKVRPRPAGRREVHAARRHSSPP